MKNCFKCLILILVVFLLCACGNEKKEEVKKKDEKKEVVEEKVKIIDVDSKTRPYAIMINCHNEALPHAGLQDAYIVYELMVEGGITRMMALFKDVDVDKIGSVRSARVQYLDYVYENDAIYINAGGAKEAVLRINNEGIDAINVDGQYGKRDTSLGRSWEHTLFTSTSLLQSAVDNNGVRQTTDSGNVLNYQAKSLDLSQYTSKKVANDISINYSYYRTSNYKYDETKKVYLRSMNDGKHVDLVTGNQYEVKNIIVYDVKYSTYCYGSYCQYQKIDNVGSGEGYYITEGYAIPITWKKSSKNSKTIYKVKETGKELVVNDGNTFIQIYPTGQSMTIK